MFNKLFGVKKEIHVTVQNTQATVFHDSVDQDGYVHLSNETHQASKVVVPSAIVQHNPIQEPDMSFNINKLSEEIPFEFSPAYSRIWSSNPYLKNQSRKLKEIDWDSLCYDFTLEKSIIQS